MLQISLDFNKKLSSFGKTIELRINTIVEQYRMNLYNTIEAFKPRMIEIAKEQTIQAGKVATTRLLESYDTALSELADTITLRLLNDARDPDYDVYYWQVINDGRAIGKKPPTESILEWMKAKALFTPMRTIRGKKGRFVKGSTEMRQAFAVAKSIGIKGIKARPEIFTQMRNMIYLELRNRMKSISGVVNG